MDITYIAMAKGYVYLAVVLDWSSRRVLSWRVSITMEASFCVAALEEALTKHGKPEIVNTDQGAQFTGETFTDLLITNGIKISMDGKGAWRDNVFVERLWRSVKYEEVYLRAYDNWMLYHVEDHPRALAEIRRVLKPGGVLFAATNGDAHLRKTGKIPAITWKSPGRLVGRDRQTKRRAVRTT